MPFAAELYEAGARIGLWNITESEAALRTGITLSPASMSLINASGSAKRRRELLAVRSLMHRMGISDNDLYYQDEKPMLRSGRFISISHSGTMACIALSAEGPVGVDIQEIKPRLSIVVRWLTKSAPDAAGRNVSLIRSGLLWTAREAMFKLAGRDAQFSYPPAGRKNRHPRVFPRIFGHRDGDGNVPSALPRIGRLCPGRGFPHGSSRRDGRYHRSLKA